VPETLDPTDLLPVAVASTHAAISIAKATEPDLPLVYVNPAFQVLTGYRPEQALGRPSRFMIGPDTDPVAVRDMGTSLRRGEFTRARMVNYRADGTTYWVDLHVSPIRDRTGVVTHFVAVHVDVTPDVLAQQEALHSASIDPLTGLMNRPTFAAELEREVSRAHRSGTSVGVLFLDLDRFKQANDTYGHLVGDRYLVHVADCLRGRLRRQDAASRSGGDEFIVLLGDLPRDGADAAGKVSADLHRLMTAPFVVDGHEHRTEVSIGTALYPRDGLTGRDLIAAADADMYRHKPPRGGRRTDT
jgi:diguanylate cyclase (GGDEF)-like protein/PAS domain S-box-containing protein